MVTITSVVPQENYTLYVEFSDGKKGTFDAKPYLQSGSMFTPLQDPSLFRSVTVFDDITIGWANGADLCPDCVYSETTFQ